MGAVTRSVTSRTAVDTVLDQDPATLALSDEGRRSDPVAASDRPARSRGFAALGAGDVHRNGVGLEDGHRRPRSAGSAGRPDVPRSAVRKVVRHAELCELLPETGQAWRDGKITTTAVELIAGARVSGFDDGARRGRGGVPRRRPARRPQGPADADHPRQGVRTGRRVEAGTTRRVHPRRSSATGASAASTSPSPTGRPSPTPSRPSPGPPPRTTTPPSPNATPKASSASARSPSHAGADAPGARPSCPTSPTNARAGDATDPLTLGLVRRGDRPPRTGPDPLRRHHRARHDRHRGEILQRRPGHRGVEPGPTPGHDQPLVPTANGPDVEIPAPWCDIHHVVHWEHGGPTDLTNGAHLCRRHHTFLHQHRDWTLHASTINTSASTDPTAPKCSPTPGTASRSSGARRGQRGASAAMRSTPRPATSSAPLAVAGEARRPVGEAAVADLDLAGPGARDHLEAQVAVVAASRRPVGIGDHRDPASGAPPARRRRARR